MTSAIQRRSVRYNQSKTRMLVSDQLQHRSRVLNIFRDTSLRKSYYFLVQMSQSGLPTYLTHVHQKIIYIPKQRRGAITALSLYMQYFVVVAHPSQLISGTALNKFCVARSKNQRKHCLRCINRIILLLHAFQPAMQL